MSKLMMFKYSPPASIVYNTSTDITPPTASTSDAYSGYVTMLLNGDAFSDISPLHNSISTSGTVSISTSVKKTGTGSMYFGGGTSVLSSPDNDAVHQFGTGDFTVDAWVYPTSYPSANGMYGNMICSNQANNYTTNWGLGIACPTSAGSAFLWFYAENPGGVNPKTTTTIALNAWTHVAACRASGVLRLFINGVICASINDSSAYKNIAYPFTVGNDSTLLSGFVGYIDSVRVTKGYGRYTTNFTAT